MRKLTEQLTTPIGPEVTFADVVFADEEWLRAEFDDIIAAEWPDPTRASHHDQKGVPTNRVGVGRRAPPEADTPGADLNDWAPKPGPGSAHRLPELP